MRAHYLQHVPFEGLGTIAPWLAERGFTITRTRFFESAQLPNPDEVDFLVIMGGPMSANDDDQWPWLAAEKKFIREYLRRNKRALGICLGAQLIADALGAAVRKNPVKEIGWFPVEGLPQSVSDSFRFPAVFRAFHWHGETFDIPAGAAHLARSKACENQAFQWGASVIGLQFHLEMTPEAARDLVSNGRAELTPSTYVQSEAALLSASPEDYRAAQGRMAELLSYLIRSR